MSCFRVCNMSRKTLLDIFFFNLTPGNSPLSGKETVSKKNHINSGLCNVLDLQGHGKCTDTMKQNQLTLHAVAVARKIVYFYAEIVKFGQNFIIFDFFLGGGANWEDFFFLRGDKINVPSASTTPTRGATISPIIEHNSHKSHNWIKWQIFLYKIDSQKKKALQHYVPSISKLSGPLQSMLIILLTLGAPASCERAFITP